MQSLFNLIDYATAAICHPLWWLDHCCYLSGNKSTDGQTPFACCHCDKLRQGMRIEREVLGDRWGLTSVMQQCNVMYVCNVM